MIRGGKKFKNVTRPTCAQNDPLASGPRKGLQRGESENRRSQPRWETLLVVVVVVVGVRRCNQPDPSQFFILIYSVVGQ